MKCNNCGNEIPNGSFQCPVCGNKMNPQTQGGFSQPGGNGFGGTQPQPDYQTDSNGAFGAGQANQGLGGYQGQGFGGYQGQGFGNPQGQGFGGPQGYNQWNGNMQRPGSAPEFVAFLIIGIVYTVCCCNIFVAIPGLIFTFLMNSRYKEGNMAAYMSNKNIAKWIYIIGVILWILGIIIGIFTGIIDIITFSTSVY